MIINNKKNRKKFGSNETNYYLCSTIKYKPFKSTTMLPKVVFQFAKPVAERYNDLDLMKDEHFTLRFCEIVDPYSVAYLFTHRAERFGEYSFVGWFIDNYFQIPPDRIEITSSEDDDRLFLSFHLIFEDDSSVNKSIVFIYG